MEQSWSAPRLGRGLQASFCPPRGPEPFSRPRTRLDISSLSIPARSFMRESDAPMRGGSPRPRSASGALHVSWFRASGALPDDAAGVVRVRLAQRGALSAGLRAGVGAAVPAAVLTNDDLGKLVDTNDEWISTRTGEGAGRRAVSLGRSRDPC